jgi:hypothetical protein
LVWCRLAIMFCPNCAAEYRPGYTSCADCRVFLVNERPGAHQLARLQRTDADRDVEGSGSNGDINYDDPGADRAPAEPGDPNEDPFCSFWKGTDLRVCTELCTVLDEAGIPHKTIHRQDHLFNMNSQSPYQLGVPASLYEKAEQAVKEAFGTDEETGEDAVPLLPAPDRESAEVEKGLRDAIADANEWLGPRYPEDATVEVWSSEEADTDTKEMIEMSLRENDLLCRSEEENGGIKLMVLPEDEARAREIVREIVEGAPLD